MKPFTTLAAAAAITVSFATSAAATCTINGDGHITGLFRSRSFNALEDNVTNVACPSATSVCPKGKALIEGDGTHWCKVDTSQLAEPLADDITANVTISYLQRAKKEGKPFFIAAGYHKPHLPFHFPAEFDIYPPADKIKPPLHPNPPKDMPQCAWHSHLGRWQQ